ncbi:hypothetical protein FRC09_004656, partial [Ceratobasidium sp. 395]
MDHALAVTDQFDSALSTIQTSDSLVNSIQPILEEGVALVVRNNWPKAKPLFCKSLQVFSDARLMLETAHSDLVRMSHEVSPLETVGEVKISDFLDTVREIGERRRNTESLILKVMKTLDEVWSHYPKMAFVNTLPPEILSLIFEFVVLSEFTDFSISGREAKEKSGLKLTRPEYPATLSKVCNLWHQVVTSTPRLWSYINLVVSGSKRDAFYLRASRSIKLAA